MRLSEWKRAAPSREAMSARVLNVVEPVLTALGADDDPYCWVAWGDDPEIRYSILAPTRAGLALLTVRVDIPGEGPRANGKLVRWSRLQLSELTLESSGGHRVIAMQIEGQILRGADAEADAIARFVRGLVAAVDGREWQPPADLHPSGSPAARRSPTPAAETRGRGSPSRKASPKPKQEPADGERKALPSGER